MEEKRNAYELLVSKTVGKRSLEAKSANTGIPRKRECVCACVCMWIGLKCLTTDTSDRQLWGSTEGREFDDMTQCRCVFPGVSKEWMYSPHLQGPNGALHCTGSLAMKMNALLTFQTSGNTNPTTQRHTPDNTAVTTPHLAQQLSATPLCHQSVIFVSHICYTVLFFLRPKAFISDYGGTQ